MEKELVYNKHKYSLNFFLTRNNIGGIRLCLSVKGMRADTIKCLLKVFEMWEASIQTYLHSEANSNVRDPGNGCRT